MSEKIPHSDETADKINELLDEAISTPEPLRYVRQVDDQLMINGVDYELVTDHKDAFDLEKLNSVYTDVLNKYDYIVGDWGYDQLRLRGFYKDTNHQANRDQLISTVMDYLYEYCNFGCAYFILKRTGAPYRPKEKSHNNRGKNTNRRNHNSRRPTNRRNNNSNNSNHNHRRKNNAPQAKERHFTVRKLDTAKPHGKPKE